MSVTNEQPSKEVTTYCYPLGILGKDNVQMKFKNTEGVKRGTVLKTVTELIQEGVITQEEQEIFASICQKTVDYYNPDKQPDQ